MKKNLYFLTALLCLLCGSVFAATENVGKVGSTNATYVGTCFTIDGAYIAGSGGVQQGNMSSTGIKLRTNQSSKLIINVNAGYKINSASIYLCANKSDATTNVTSVTVDGIAKDLSGAIPLNGATDPGSLDIILTDIDATDNITINFTDGSKAQIVGDFNFEYTQEAIVVQEISSVAIGGVDISSSDLETLKSTKTLSIDGSAYNGLPTVVPTIENGATTVTCDVTGSTAKYQFTINGDQTYTINLTGIAKVYAKQGKVIAYKEGDTEAEGANTNTISLNGITFKMENTEKTFQYGSGSVTLGDKTYKPIKLSTGSAVNVTFPDGFVATKVVVYGWSASNNGKLYSFKESVESDKSVNVSDDIYYSGNKEYDKYPSVYEYELDEWESAYFNAGGSPSQPFVVMDFVLVKKNISSIVNAEVGYATFYSKQERTIPANTQAYTGELNGNYLTLTEITGGVIPAATAVVISGDGGDFTYSNTGVTTSNPNDLQGTAVALATKDVTGGTVCVLGYENSTAGFYKYTGETLGANKAYLVVPDGGVAAPKIRIVFNDETTAINGVQNNENEMKGETYNLAGQRVSSDFNGIVIKNGKKVLVK